MHHMIHADTEDQQSHVSVGQVSHVSQQSDEDILPLITPRNGTLKTPKPASKPPVLRYTYNKDQRQHRHVHAPTSVESDDVENSVQPESSPRGVSSQSDLRKVILPRLPHSEQKCSSPSRNGDSERLKFPYINKISRVNAHLALNRSITDLLDPEMEILNKIKHIPKRTRRKRRQKTINANGAPVLKTDKD